MKTLILIAPQWKEMTDLRLWLWLRWLERYSVRDRFCISVIWITFDDLSFSSSTDFAKSILLQSTKWHQIIYNRDSSTHVALFIRRWQRIEEDLSDAKSFHEDVSNKFWGENRSIDRLRILFKLRLNIVYRSDDVILCLNLLLERSLWCFNESFHDTFDFSILVVNWLFFCLIQKLELWWLNAMIELILTIAQCLNFCLLTKRFSLFIDQSFESSQVDQLTHLIDRLNQLRTWLRVSICDLNVISNHAKQVVAMKNNQVDLIHDQIANSLVEVKVVWWMIMSSLLSWIRSLKTHRWWCFLSLIEYNKSWRLARSLFLLLIVLLSHDTYCRKALCQARFEILVLFAQVNETLKRLTRSFFTKWVDNSISFKRSASELSQELNREQDKHHHCRRDWWCKILHRKKNLYQWRMCRFYCRLVRLMNSIFWLSLMISCTFYETWFWWVSAAMWASLFRWSYRAK